MLDDEDEDHDHAGVCRDETCSLDYIHPSHVFPLHAPPKRGRPKQPWWMQTDPQAYRRPDPVGVAEAMRRAFESTDWPLAFVDVHNAVRNDYGEVAKRTLHRHIRRLIDISFVVELDLDLTHLAYIRQGSKFLGDPDNLRDNLMGRHEQFFEARSRRNRSSVVVAP